MRGAIVALTAAALLSGCVTTQKDKVDRLKDSVEGYNEAYRWKNFERAAAFLPQDLRAPFIATYEDDEKSLHVEDYQILKVNLESEDNAQVLVRLRYMLLPSVTIETRMLTQHWHQISGAWILETEDNSIREIDPNAIPQNPDAFGGGEDAVEGETKIEVTGPDGQVLRKEGGEMETEAEKKKDE